MRPGYSKGLCRMKQKIGTLIEETLYRLPNGGPPKKGPLSELIQNGEIFQAILVSLRGG